jgi:Spy/CpxP family protein refolding chaperone
MVKRSIAVLSLVALLGGTGIALAQDAKPNPGPRDGAHRMGRMHKDLGLTDEQKAAVRGAFQKHRDEQRQVGQQLRTAQAELRQLALNGADAGAIQAKTNEVQQLTGQSLAVRVKVLQEIGPVLTPEQRTKFAQASFGHGGHGNRGHRKPATQS